MFDVAIYGDDVPFLERIEKYTVGALFDEDELIIDLYDDGAELVNEINKTKNKYDLIFLSLDDDDKIPFAMAENIRKNDIHCELVFLSGESEYVINSFSYKPFDYLIEPVTKQAVFSLFDRYKYYHNGNTDEYFSFKCGSAHEKIKINSILYFCSSGRKITIVTSTQNFEFYSKLDEIETLLSENCFIRIHQSFLVNPRYIKYLVNAELILENDDCLPISRSRLKNVKNSYLQYLSQADTVFYK